MENIISSNRFRELLIPTVLIAMALNITAIADSMFVSTFVGQYGQAALQILEPLILLITVFEWLFGLGGQILSLNKKAEFDNEGSNLYFTVAIVTAILMTLIIGVICLIFPNQVAALLNSPKDIIPYVNEYGFYLYINFPIVTALAVLTQFVRVDGQPNLASALIIIANAINIILDFLFLGVFHMGIGGASLASLIGYVIGMVCVLKYHFDPKRTYEFIHHSVPVKKWIRTVAEICKVGIPGASMGVFDVLYAEVMNIIVIATIGTIGLNAFNIATQAFLVISIFTIGISETLSSIVPVYYSQDDYLNLNHLLRRSFILSGVCAVAFVAFLWIYPNGFLIFFNIHNHSAVLTIQNALQIYSIAFIPNVLSTILIFYYEAIERTTVSTIISIIATFAGPLAMAFLLYPVMGENGIWISLAAGTVLSIIIAAIYVKIVEKREPEYNGLFFIKKDLIPKTRNYTVKAPNDRIREEIRQHLADINADDESFTIMDELVDAIFRFNDNNVIVELLIIDYDDRISINIKDEGKQDLKNNIDAELSDNENIKFTEVLGFNNVEYESIK